MSAASRTLLILRAPIPNYRSLIDFYDGGFSCFRGVLQRSYIGKSVQVFPWDTFINSTVEQMGGDGASHHLVQQHQTLLA